MNNSDINKIDISVIIDQYKTFLDLTAKISFTYPLKYLLKEVAVSIFKVFHPKFVEILIYDEKENLLKQEFLKIEGEEDEILKKKFLLRDRAFFQLPINKLDRKNPVLMAFKSGKPIFDIHRNELSFPSEEIKRFVEELLNTIEQDRVSFLPIKSNNKVYGIMITDFSPKKALSHHDRLMIMNFSSILGCIIKNYKAVQKIIDKKEDLEKRSKELLIIWHLVFEISQIIALSNEFEKLLNEVINHLKKHEDIDNCGILLIINQNKKLKIESKVKLNDNFLKKISQNIIHSFNKLSGNLLSLEDLDFEVISSNKSIEHGVDELRAFLNIPIIFRKEVFGILHISSFNKTKFSDYMLQFIQSISYQMALCIERIKKTEKREEYLMKTIIEGLPHGAILMDGAGNVISANSRGYEFIQKICNCMLSDKKCFIHEILKELFSSGKRKIDRQISYKEQYLKLQASTAMFPPAIKGEELGAVLTIEDITEEKNAQEQMFRASKLASIGEFSAGIAHEINNPLTTIIGSLELLLSEVKDKYIVQTLNIIKQEAYRTKEIVQSLLSLARSEHIEESPIDLNEIISFVIRLMRKKFDSHGIKIVEDYTEDLPLTAGNPANIQQVIINILQNSMDAITLNNKGSTIKVRTFKNNHNIGFEIEDDGPGIPEELRDRIFNPFFTTKPPDKGTGLGLSISNKIVEEHGGRIIVKSLPGKGSIFSVEIPLRKIKKAKKPSHKAIPYKKSPPGKALVIDDEILILNIIKRMLTKQGWEVDTTDDGEGALDILKTKTDYDIILLDIKMPRITGQQLFERIKRQNPELLKKIIFMSGDVLSQESLEFLKSTGQPYITKPFSSNELIDSIRKIQQDKF